MSKIQSVHYRNLPDDPLGTGLGSLGICRSHFRNHCSKCFLTRFCVNSCSSIACYISHPS